MGLLPPPFTQTHKASLVRHSVPLINRDGGAFPGGQPFSKVAGRRFLREGCGNCVGIKAGSRAGQLSSMQGKERELPKLGGSSELSWAGMKGGLKSPSRANVSGTDCLATSIQEVPLDH